MATPGEGRGREGIAGICPRALAVLLWGPHSAALGGKGVWGWPFSPSWNGHQLLRNSACGSFTVDIAGLQGRRWTQSALFCVENSVLTHYMIWEENHIPLCGFTVFYLKHKIRVVECIPFTGLNGIIIWQLHGKKKKKNFKESLIFTRILALVQDLI